MEDHCYCGLTEKECGESEDCPEELYDVGVNLDVEPEPESDVDADPVKVFAMLGQLYYLNMSLTAKVQSLRTEVKDNQKRADHYMDVAQDAVNRLQPLEEEVKNLRSIKKEVDDYWKKQDEIMTRLGLHYKDFVPSRT